MKKILCCLIAVIALFTLVSCAGKKTLHCDNCGKEVSVSKNSNMDESWIVLCDNCDEELLGDNPSLNDYSDIYAEK